MINKTIGLVGSGQTASPVASRALAFGMRVQYDSRSGHSPSNVLGKCTKTIFEGLVRTSDIISLHVPLTSSTRHMLSSKEFQGMKDGVAIINTARGEVVNNTALVEALRDEKVWGVGLDVYDQEGEIPVEIFHFAAYCYQDA